MSNKTFAFVNSEQPAPRERKKPKTSLFLSAKIDTPFRGHGGLCFGKNLGMVGLALLGWPFLPRRGGFIPKDECVDCDRPRERRTRDDHDEQLR